MKTALERKGFTFIEIVSQCPTAYGRRAKTGDSTEMLKWFKKFPVRKKGEAVEHTVPTQQGMDLGVFADRHELEFTEALEQKLGHLGEIR
jgi:2-oxoglutarate ferredoxin oxidoreductase subunit beta